MTNMGQSMFLRSVPPGRHRTTSVGIAMMGTSTEKEHCVHLDTHIYNVALSNG